MIHCYIDMFSEANQIICLEPQLFGLNKIVLTVYYTSEFS